MSEEQTEYNKQDFINVSEFLSELDRNSIESAFQIFTPSDGKSYYFKELNTAQQKELLKSSIDSPLSQNKFTIAFFNILKQNFLDRPNFQELNVFDKYVIAFQIKKSIANTCEVEHDEEKFEVVLDDVVEKAKTIYPKLLTDSIIEDEKYKVVCQISSIENEFNVEKEIKRKTDDLTIKDTDELRQILAQLVVQEISKYIKSIEIKSDGRVLAFEGLSLNNKLAVVEKLPMVTTKKIIKFIDGIKLSIDEYRTFLGKNEKGDEKEVQVSLDAALFIS